MAMMMAIMMPMMMTMPSSRRLSAPDRGEGTGDPTDEEWCTCDDQTFKTSSLRHHQNSFSYFALSLLMLVSYLWSSKSTELSVELMRTGGLISGRLLCCCSKDHLCHHHHCHLRHKHHDLLILGQLPHSTVIMVVNTFCHHFDSFDHLFCWLRPLMVFGCSTPALSPLFCKNLDNFIVCGGKYLAMGYIDM